MATSETDEQVRYIVNMPPQEVMDKVLEEFGISVRYSQTDEFYLVTNWGGDLIAREPDKSQAYYRALRYMALHKMKGIEG